MSEQEHAALARKLYDLFNRHAFDEVLDFVADEVEAEVYGQNLSFRGRDGFRAMMVHHKTGWPDGTVTVLQQFSGPEGVVNECVYRATHTGPLPLADGSMLPATGKAVELRFCELWRIRDGKVQSLRNYGDSLGLMMQLGVIPAPATPEG